MQRGATWRASLHVCDGRSPTLSELPSCYPGDDWSGCSLQEFMDCPYNLANNRQVRRGKTHTHTHCELQRPGCHVDGPLKRSQRSRVKGCHRFGPQILCLSYLLFGLLSPKTLLSTPTLKRAADSSRDAAIRHGHLVGARLCRRADFSPARSVPDVTG